ncbi:MULTISPECIES: acetyl/propionyl/methylcrotonyl-CoA carboxylase subunit alpha [unclassified Streptomyces]|uniref:acetyl/propionyl/methylcrotonyl-CoA carboxylase subunit alpha n=1 Tax=unclassified Streptomyces TaxID=2593676 RepID=UPI0016602349|nr:MULTISPECIES: biotin carboxylase N-terminal domain-containing protein [unclassified Streptomyces]MBD0707254.1 acety-l/propionyl-CoA carboxylase subunit alpha [Streptomyces sp. CBMA291]MBD0713742.1 acety-l/propionyl-CoA carboxylase subunit alpha [Streptomyces sp. CBMA370]
MMTSVLVANRGEIACRVFRTCRELGLATVAVYSDADAGALHVREADTAVRLPGAAPSETYLRGDLVIAAARAAGADAVHPGYGFLSENADFARAVLAAGLTWIGPPPEAIEAMASKTRAKELLGIAPLAPEDVREADLPVLVKAAAGGGGRGMRIVRELASLQGELASASTEAASAFGDGEVFVEPYVEDGRHIEVQLLCDAHGTVWALGTRDCTLQRRHQKVIEEAPAPGLPAPLEASLLDTAVRAAKSVGYVGAGTVEFLVADGRAHFLEMNTRLQVEHPVTEEVYGVDLVALQIGIAEGHALPPEPPAPHGHAVEARLYAEDPARAWAPQTGVLHAFGFPREGRVRVDSGYEAGDAVGVHYDPMLAKVTVHAATREQAVRKLAHTLERARVHGPVTNRDLLVASLRHPEFTTGEGLSTGFYDRHLTGLTAPGDEGGGAEAAAVAAALATAATAATTARGRFGGGWRNLRSQDETRTYGITRKGEGGSAEEGEIEVRYRPTRDGGYEVTAPAGIRVVATAPRRVSLEVAGVVRHMDVDAYGDGVVHAGRHRLVPRPRFADPRERTAPGSLLAPMPGTVVRVADGLAVGDRVTAGRPLLWLEAMKMEHRVTAPASGTLTALHATPGRQVEMGTLLAVVLPEEHP